MGNHGAFHSAGGFQFDPSTGGVNTLTYAHHEVHRGKFFVIHHTGSALNDGDKINVYMKTPATKEIHVLPQLTGSGAAYFRVREAPTVTANTGTNGQAIYNSFRGSIIASTVLDNATTPAANKYGINVTITGDGTVIMQQYNGVAKFSGAEVRGTDELILAASTAYVFEAESDASGLVLNMVLSWYEHTSRV